MFIPAKKGSPPTQKSRLTQNPAVVRAFLRLGAAGVPLLIANALACKVHFAHSLQSSLHFYSTVTAWKVALSLVLDQPWSKAAAKLGGLNAKK